MKTILLNWRSKFFLSVPIFKNLDPEFVSLLTSHSWNLLELQISVSVLICLQRWRWEIVSVINNKQKINHLFIYYWIAM